MKTTLRLTIAAFGLAIFCLSTAVVQAQDYTYITNNGTITITRYTGLGGAVTIPNMINGLLVTTIGGYYNNQSWQGAFQNCWSLTSVTIPNCVTSIGDLAFAYCSSLTAITVDSHNPTYSSVDGVLFDKSQATLILCPEGKAGTYTIPTSVTGIGDGAFYSCTRLGNVTIPNSVVSIGNNAFSSCYGLTGVTIPNSVITIGDDAFFGCLGLTNVTIPDSVINIGDWAVSNCSGLRNVTIGKSVASIGDSAFARCPSLTAITVDGLNSTYSSVDGVLFDKSQATLIEFPGGKAGSYAIPNGVASIGEGSFSGCLILSVTIPNSVTSIGDRAFGRCYGLTNVIIGNSVASIGNSAFTWCQLLTSVYFLGSAPSLGEEVFYFWSTPPNPQQIFDPTTFYYLPGTTGWGTTFGGRPTALWVLPPAIQTPPQTQTAEVGSAVGLRVEASSPLPLFYLWCFNYTNLIGCSTNCQLNLTNVQFSQSGAYTVVISNALGTITSSPALLQVVAPVERRTVPGLTLMGQTGSSLNLESTDAVGRSPNWAALDSVMLSNAAQWYFDLSTPHPPQRFYRAWQATPSQPPSLDLHMFPAITLTGDVGGSVRLDYINQFGPIDAWVTLATVTLTNTSQLYFDTSVIGQPPRLWRTVPGP